MNISVAVMAHPKRYDQAKKLLAELKTYPFSDVWLCMDLENVGEWQNGCDSLRHGLFRGDWHLVIQDDAILTPNFYENIIAAIKAVPTKVLISLYVGTGKPMPDRVQEVVDRTDNGAWIQASMLFWGVAILVPSDHIEPILDFVSDPMFDNTLYDTRLGMFYERNMLPVYYTMPSLVDHDDDIPSLLGHDKDLPIRKAHRLADGLIQWTDKVTLF